MSRIRTNLITNRMANGAPTVSNGLVISGVTTVTTLDVNGTSDFSGDAVFNSDVDIVDAIVHVGDTDTKIRFPAADTISFETTGSEKLRLTSTGQLLVNTTSASISSNELFEVKSTGGGFSHFRNNSSTYAPIYIDNEASNGGATLVPLITMTDGGGNRAGFLLNNSSQFDISAAGSLSFSTGSNVGSATERLRIDSDGRLLMNGASSTQAFSGGDDLIIGNTSSNTRSGITLVSNSAEDGGIYFSDGTSSGNAHVQGQIVYDHGSSIMRLYTNATERLRMHSDGKITIATGSRNAETTTGGLLIDKDVTAESDASDKNNYHLVVRSQTNSNTSKIGIAFANTTDDTHVGAAILHHRESTDSIGSLAFYTSPSSGTTTERMKIDRNGNVTKPSQPVFVAQKSVAITGTGYVTCNTVITNVGSHYDSSNGRFTAPVTGKYWFAMSINGYKRMDFQLRRNGSSSGAGNRQIGQFNTSNLDGWWTNIVQRVFELNANDYVQPWVNNIYQNSDPGEWITFQGYLIC